MHEPGDQDQGGSQSGADQVVEWVARFLNELERNRALDVDEFCLRVPEALRADVRERCIDVLFIRRAMPHEGDSIRSQDVSGGPELGDFRLLREIGRGGMGVVYLARQRSLDRLVAVKVLLASQARSARNLERFRREAQSAAKLQHRGIVPIHAVGESGGVHYFVMDFISGLSLHQEIEELRKRRPGEPPHSSDRLGSNAGASYYTRVCELIAQLADALQFAHQNGIIHRDVKPQNVLVDHDGAPHLADFGLAKDIEHDTLSGTGDLLGTLHYMSPEQAAAKRLPIDQRTDIYSLGVVLYELLTLRRPFEGKSMHEVVMKISLRDPTPVRQINRAVPRDLETICAKAMEKQPARRYASAGEFAADLRRFLAHESIIARPPSTWELWRRKIERHRVFAVAACVAVLAMLSGFGVEAHLDDRKAMRELADNLRPLRELSQAELEQESVERLAQALKDANKYVKQVAQRSPDDLQWLTGLIVRIGALGQEWKRRGLAERARFADPAAPALIGPVAPAFGAESYWSMQQSNALLRDAAQLLTDDAELRSLSDARASLPRVRITSNEPGAVVSLRRFSADGSPGEPIPLGTTPTAELRIPPGYYRIVVDGPGVGFAELTRYLDRPGRLYDVRARLRPTSSVFADDMLAIPAGPTWFGDRQPDAAALDARRQLQLHAFRIDRSEVSNAKYRAFLEDTGHSPPPLWKGGYDSAWSNLPVAGVSWLDAVDYAEWAGKRLPSQYEWERAARGVEGWLFPWGDEPGEIGSRAILDRPETFVRPDFDPLANYLIEARPVSSGREGASAAGLLHVLDNVREWSETMDARESDGILVLQPGQALLLGGFWCAGAKWNLARRGGMYIGNRANTTGFRCAKSESTNER